jgi:NADH-quinone oxidoreductase subunit N
MSKIDIIAAAPFACLSFGILAILLLDLFRVGTKPFPRLWWGAGICITTAFLYWPFFGLKESAFYNTIQVDAYTFLLSMFILAGSAITFFLNDEQLEGQRVSSSIDVDVLLLMATLGGLVMVAAADLITMFIGFELLSMSVYVLTGSARKERASSEGALKYFVLGAFSSAFLLYGMALIYGATGTLNLCRIPPNALYIIRRKQPKAAVLTTTAI